MEVMVQKDILTLKDFHEKLFEEYYPDYSVRDVEVAASVLGADAEEVVKAGRERRRSYAIKWDIERGREYGIEEPLRVAVNRTPVEDNRLDTIERAIERNL